MTHESNYVKCVKWFPFNTDCPDSFPKSGPGEFLVAENPIGYEHMSIDQCNECRKTLRSQIAWWKDGRWFESKDCYYDMTSRITHWAERPDVPFLIDKKKAIEDITKQIGSEFNQSFSEFFDTYGCADIWLTNIHRLCNDSLHGGHCYEINANCNNCWVNAFESGCQFKQLECIIL